MMAQNKRILFENSLFNSSNNKFTSSNSISTLKQMQVLLVFSKEDAQLSALKLAIQKRGYLIRWSKTLDDACEAFIEDKFDLVFIDSRSNDDPKFDYENICRSIRKLCSYTVIIAVTSNFDDKNVPSVLPYLKAGFNKIFNETTNQNRLVNELLTLEYGEVANMQRLQAAHALFTALEYTNDPVEIMNDHFKLLYVNSAFEKLTGYTLEEITGKDFSDLHRSDVAINTIKEHMVKGNAWEGNLNFRKASGDFVTQLTKTIPVLVNGGKLHNYISVTYVQNNNNNSSNSNNQKLANCIKPVSIDESNHYLANNINHLPSTTQLIQQQQQQQQQQIPVSFSSASLPANTNAIRDTPAARLSYDLHNGNNIAQRKRSYDVRSNALFEGLPYTRRHSMARVHALAVEAPITKAINIIAQAQEKAQNDLVKQNLDRAIEILRSTELYNPITLHENDKHTSALVSGLMSNGSQKRNSKTDIFTNRINLSSSSVHNDIKNLSPEISQLLENERIWSFDILELERMTNKRPLITLGLKIMNRFNVCEFLKCDEAILVNWLTLMETNYRPSNPYHNSTHASDVLHATAYFLGTDKLAAILDNADKVGSLLAAAVHDLNHPGRTNAFLCNSNNDLSILYNDQAVLENHHSALAFQLTLQHENANIFQNLTRDEYRAIRSVVIDMVLATEMSKHFEHLNKFVNKFSVNENEPNQPVLDEESLKNPDNKVLIKRILIKCADVSNPCRPLNLCKEWAKRIAEEYFQQTDDEKSKGLPVVMPIFDRASCNIPKAQISFIEYFITDMFDAWHDFTNIKEVMEHLEKNITYWREACDVQQDCLHTINNNNNNNNTNPQTKSQNTSGRNDSIVEVVDENT